MGQVRAQNQQTDFKHTVPRRAWMAMALIVAATMVAYWPALHAGWIWDDDAYVTGNPVVQLSDGIWRAWFPGQTPQYYPLVFVSFWLQHSIHGLHPLGFHLVNVLLHAASALLLWRILVRLGVPGALVAVAIFALHPVQVESVAWVTERKNVLSMMFALSSVGLWLQWSAPPGNARGRAVWLALSFMAFLAAMLSKTTAAAVPVALLAVEWWRGNLRRDSVLILLLLYMPVAVAMGLFTARVELVHVGAVGPEFDRSFVERLAQAAQAWWFYPSSWIWPADLTFIYPAFTQGPEGVLPWLALASVVATVAVAWRLAARGHKGFAALLIMYGAGIFPALGFLNVYPLRYAPVADHFGYVAGVAICVCLGWLISSAWTAWRGRSTAAGPRTGFDAVGALVAALGVVLLSAITYVQCTPYADEATLWRWTLDRNPHAWIASNNLAGIQLAAARDALARKDTQALAIHLAEAEVLASAAVEDTQGREMPALANLGETLRLQGRLAEALVVIDRAVAANPRYPGVLWQRARLRELTGDLTGAGQDYGAASQGQPANVDYLRDWIRWLTAQQRLPEARDASARLVALLPSDATAAANLASLMLECGDAASARAQYESAMQLADPELAARIVVRMIDACLRAPFQPVWIERGKELAKKLVEATDRAQAIPLLLLARAQALSSDPLGARATLDEADALLAHVAAQTAPSDADDARLRARAAAEYRTRVMEALGASPQSRREAPHPTGFAPDSQQTGARTARDTARERA